MHEDVIVQEFLAALQQGALDDARAALAEEVVAFPRVGRGEPVVRGREAFIARFERLLAEGMELEMTGVETLKPCYVLAGGRATHRGHDYELFVLAVVRDGCIRMLESHTSRDRALATVGR
jgi:ketosteroid isomerase-like protein